MDSKGFQTNSWELILAVKMFINVLLGSGSLRSCSASRLGRQVGGQVGLLPLLAVFYAVSVVPPFGFSQDKGQPVVHSWYMDGVKLTISSPSLELVPDLCKHFLKKVALCPFNY